METFEKAIQDHNTLVRDQILKSFGFEDKKDNQNAEIGKVVHFKGKKYRKSSAGWSVSDF
jgi:hypothetical protein